MDRLTMSGRRTPGISRALAMLAGGIATIAALAVAAMLAVFAVATVVVILMMATALLGFAAAARRARRTVSRQPAADPGYIEARNVGGHNWIAYGWDGQRR
jgi:hypothetical protein